MYMMCALIILRVLFKCSIEGFVQLIHLSLSFTWGGRSEGVSPGALFHVEPPLCMCGVCVWVRVGVCVGGRVCVCVCVCVSVCWCVCIYHQISVQAINELFTLYYSKFCLDFSLYSEGVSVSVCVCVCVCGGGGSS